MRTEPGDAAVRTAYPQPTTQDLINVLSRFKAAEECKDRRCRFCRATRLLEAVEQHGGVKP